MVRAGIYVAEEGIGVRIETDVVVADTPINLMPDMPVEREKSRHGWNGKVAAFSKKKGCRFGHPFCVGKTSKTRADIISSPLFGRSRCCRWW